MAKVGLAKVGLSQDLEVSVSSTVPASSRALRCLRLVSGRARDEPAVPMGPDAVVHVIADPDSEILSDTATDPDLGARVDHEEESDRNSSGDDSVVDDREAHEAMGDVFVRPCDASRIRKSGSCRSGQFVQVKSIGDEVSTEVLAWRLPFGTPGRFDRSRSGICSWGRCASESSLEALSASPKNATSQTCSWGSGPQGEVEGEVHSVHAGSVGGSDFRKPAV